MQEIESMILLTGNNWQKSRDAVIRTNNPTMIKLYEWMLYRDDYSSLPFDQITRFINENPHWPNQIALRKTAERNIQDTQNPDHVIAWFTKHPPLTGQGVEKLLNAAQKTGLTNQIAPIIRKSWAICDIDTKDTTKLWPAINSLIDLKTQEERLDKLLFSHQYTNARHLASLMNNGFPQLTEARIALAEDKPTASTLITHIPLHLRNNTGLKFERLSWRRRHNEDAGALEILNAQPPIATTINSHEWWKERHIMIRRMIEKKDFKTAYHLASRHGQSNHDKASKSEAEWMAGWLALRFTNQPQESLTHFTTMYQTVGTSISLSRGAYWAGRASETLGQKDEATQWYKIAATHPHTYYGQLSIRKIPNSPLQLPTLPQPTLIDQQKIANSDLLTAVLITHHARLHTLHSLLTAALIETLETPGDYMEAAKLLNSEGDQTASYKVAKAASWKNIFLGKYAYPNILNSMQNLPGNHALYHAIIRQESQFDTEARSPAGALGLMQIMPATAKETAKKIGEPHQTGWLTSRPHHNILLGSTYINALLSRADNAYPIAIAGYNAGPTRATNWINQFGDPRLGKLDWIDWIELVPISETRNYIQRVLENYFVYNEYMGME